MAGVAALAVLPLFVGEGPFAADSLVVRASRVLIFAPLLARSLGWLLIARTIAERAEAGGPARVALVVLLLADLLVGSWRWWSTPFAVVARVHPMEASWPALVPWWTWNALCLWMLRRRPVA